MPPSATAAFHRYWTRSTRGVDLGHILTLAAFAGLVVLAVGFVGFILWPRSFASSGVVDAPTIPVTVAGTAFNLPTAAIRLPVQRRPGAQERVDLAFLWPSLSPPDPAAKPAPVDQPLALERMFITITARSGSVAPADLTRTIYPRYLSGMPTNAPGGLMAFSFREGSPYQGEDLVMDPEAPDKFVARCSRSGHGGTPGICLVQKRIGGADVTVRFPRDWLSEWQYVARGIEHLLASMRPAQG
jgi:hypothetical protein